MRTARLVGLSPDGKSLIVATDSGEHLAIPADERLRAAVHGDRPRLGQLEIDMESALSPREIQSRIRAGGSLEEVARAAGMPIDRVERFATPVLAEREYVAGQAMGASVRRRGETSGHRNLRATVSERLRGRGVDLDTLGWDSYRMADGRWGVTAEYRFGKADRRALFVYDVRSRFSVAGNDEAQWILGDQSPAKGLQPGRRRPVGSDSNDTGADPDAEPTLDLSDELAIVRAVQEAPPAPAEVIVEAEQLAGVSELRPVRQARPPDAAAEAELGSEPPPPSVESTAETAVEAVADHPSEGRRPVGQDQRLPDSAQDQRLPDSAQDQPLPDSAQDQPLPDSAQEQRAVAGAAHGGASDASAVPEVAAEQGGGWEPAIVVNYPVEPSQVESGEERGEQLSLLEHPPSRPRHRPPVPAAEEAREAERVRGTDEPGPPDSPVQIEDREDEADALEEEQEPAPETVEKPKPARTRKRASVPSWDEIMFGSPKQRP